MSEFRYVGIDNVDGDVEGTLETADHFSALEHLRARGIYVHSLVQVDEVGASVAPPQLSKDEINMLFEYLYEITSAGLPIPSALMTFSADAPDGALRESMIQLAAEMEQGKPLSEALEKQNAAMPTLYISLVRAGEQSGSLSSVLGELLRHTKEIEEIRAGLQESLVYPLIVLFTAYLLFAFNAVFITPAFERIYSDIGLEFPILSRISSEIGSSPVLLLGIPLFGIFSILVFRHFAKKADSVQNILFRLPAVGAVYRLALITRFSRTLSMLLSNRVELHDALVLAGAATDSRIVERMSEQAADESAAGENIDDILRHMTVLRAKDTWILSQGVKMGQLEKAAKRLESSCSAEFERVSRRLLRLTGPVAISIVGFFVLFLALSVYTPIFTMPGVLR